MHTEFWHALRSLTRSRGHSLAAVATLAIGIGAATAIVSVINGVLLRPLAYPDSEALVRVIEEARDRTVPSGLQLRYAEGLELTELDVIRVRTKTLSHIAAYEVAPSTLLLGG